MWIWQLPWPAQKYPMARRCRRSLLTIQAAATFISQAMLLRSGGQNRHGQDQPCGDHPSSPVAAQSCGEPTHLVELPLCGERPIFGAVQSCGGPALLPHSRQYGVTALCGVQAASGAAALCGAQAPTRASEKARSTPAACGRRRLLCAGKTITNSFVGAAANGCLTKPPRVRSASRMKILSPFPIGL